MTHNQDEKDLNPPAEQGVSEAPLEHPVENETVPVQLRDNTDCAVNSDDMDSLEGKTEPEDDEAPTEIDDHDLPRDENCFAHEEEGASEYEADVVPVADDGLVIDSNSLTEDDLGRCGSVLEEYATDSTDTAKPTQEDMEEHHPDSKENVFVDNDKPDEGGKDSSETTGSQVEDNDLILKKLEHVRLEDSGETAKERQEMADALNEAGIWIEKQRRLQSALNTLKNSFNQILGNFEEVDKGLPENIRDELASRKEGIQLCGRMLDRAQARICKAVPQEEKDSATTELNELQVEELQSNLCISSLEDIEEKVGKFLKFRRIDHSKKIADVRNRARTAEKSFLSGVERQVLPIIDGLDEGKKIGAGAIDKLIEQFPDVAGELRGWFEIYDLLIEQLESELGMLGLQPQIAAPGEPVDYELYDPVDVEEDPQFEDEQIKEMVRRGYMMVETRSGVDLVVRPGQVVVVKNPPKE